MTPPKYALMEHERRFLVREAPDHAAAPCRRIEDLYLDAGRLRLRAVADERGARVFKLCKKYGSDDPVSEPITNLYLTAEEHAAFAGLPGRRLVKRRYSVDDVSLDVFEGPLHGLLLCEAEGERAAILERAFPAWCGREVTADPRFAGGALARLDAAGLAALLAGA